MSNGQYNKICDIFATSVDYDAKTQANQQFSASVQNKIDELDKYLKSKALLYLKKA